MTLRPLTDADVVAHDAGEDDETIRWLSGGRGTAETTRTHFAMLAENLRAGRGKRGFGVWLDDRLAGYVDFDPDNRDGLDPGDVNIAYAVHPWARGRGLAARAVDLLCKRLQQERLGTAAALRIEPENTASIRVAEKSGFVFVREFESATDVHADGRPVTMGLFRRPLSG